MIKYIAILVTSLWVMVASGHGDRYYLLHPKVVQNAMASCDSNQTTALNCKQIEAIASRLNEAAYQLQSNPQGYGQIILKLQQDIAQKESQLQKKPHEPALLLSLKASQQELQERLAIVKWLESPEG